MTLRVPYMPDDAIERDAEALLAQYAHIRGVEIKAPIPIEDIVEKHLKLRVEFDDLHRLLGVPRSGLGLDPDIFGAIWLDTGKIVIDESLDPEERPAMEGRYRFTLAHEGGGHWRLHRGFVRSDRDQEIMFTDVPKPAVVCRSSQAKERVEWQADFYASCLLMPGSNIAIEVRWADGRYERLPALVAELIGLKVDIIVVAATPGSLAVKSATNTIPVVIVAVSDPTRIGLVASLVRPGGNITGLSLLTPELSGKRLQLLVEIAPKTNRVTVLINPSNRSHTIFLDETAAAGKQLQIRIQTVEARNPDEIDSAFQEIEKQASQALIVFDDPVIWSHRKQVVALADKARLPVMYGYSEFVLEGGLISYGPNRPDLYRRTAGYVDLILKGAKPAELPIERPTRFELMINAKTAKALDLEIPTAILIQADRVIE